MKGYPKPKRHFSEKNLLQSWSNSRDSKPSAKAAGIDGITPQQFINNLNQNIAHLSRQLCGGSFRFSLLRPIAIPKKSGKYRIICIPTVQDRLVQRRICEWLSSADALGIVNRVSYGFRAGLGVGAAVKQARILRKTRPYIMKSDISSFFDEIDRGILINKLQHRLGNVSLIPFIKSSIGCEIDSNDEFVKSALSTTSIVPGKGLRQGMPISPILSNFVLRDFDIGIQRHGLRMVRYADDILIACRTRQECLDAFDISKMLLAKIGHQLPDVGAGKTEIVEPADAVEFLGYEIALTRPGNYDIFVPPHAFTELDKRLDIFHDFNRCQSKYRHLDKAIISLENQLSGLSAAYADAKNIDKFRNCLKDKGRNAAEAIWVGIFGRKALKKLSPRRRSFLKLD